VFRGGATNLHNVQLRRGYLKGKAADHLRCRLQYEPEICSYNPRTQSWCLMPYRAASFCAVVASSASYP
jgi:hypothetical protein